MRKCPRCNVTFEDESLIGCLYCEALLVKVADPHAEVKEKIDICKKEPPRLKVRPTHQNKIYWIGALLNRRTFLSSFAFSCNDIKRNRKAQRFFVQPLDVSFFIKIPWLIVNVVYSIFFHMLHLKYCPWCNTRYFVFYHFQELRHPKEDCDYCKQYNRIADEIFNKKSHVDLRALRRESQRLLKEGKRSAFYDLTNRNVKLERFLDILSILTSFGIYIYLLVRLTMPTFANIYQF